MNPEKNINKLEVILLAVLAVTTLLGIYWGFTNEDFFENRYLMEDGEIEYATVALLLTSCTLVVIRWLRLHRDRSFRFTLVSLAIVTSSFFIAGEELSWGQRIFELETTDYFKENNAQEELNLHNLVVGGVKINKLIFGVILTTLILVYLVLIPILYKRVRFMKELLDRWHVPIPRLRHSLAYLGLILIVSLIPNGKKWELLEFGTVLIFFLILWTPVNHQVVAISPEKNKTF